MQTTIDSGELSQTIDAKMIHAVRTTAIVAGAVASGYAAYRLLRSKRSPVRQFEHDIEEWVTEQVDLLKKDLNLGLDKAEHFKNEIEKWVRSGMKVARKSVGAASPVRNLLRLATEKKFVAMKLHLHNELDLKAELEIDALHRFYAELWAKMFPDVQLKTIVR